MRICIFNGSFPPMKCGVGYYAAVLAEELAIQHHQVSVITANIDDTIDIKNNVNVLPVMNNWSVSHFFKFYLTFKRLKADLVISQYPHMTKGSRNTLIFFLPFLAKVLLPTSKMMFIVHEYHRSIESDKKKLKKCFRWADEIIVLDPEDKQSIIQDYPLVGKKIRMSRTGSTIPKIEYSKEALSELKESTGLKKGQHLLLFFGLLNPEKGFEDLLSVVARNKHIYKIVTNAVLDTRNPYHKKISNLIEKLRVTQSICWIGSQPGYEMSKWLQAADVVVLPFLDGAAPNKTSLVAALFNKCPVITTYGTSTPSYLKNEQNVILIPSSDQNALKLALDDICGDTKLKTRLKKNLESLTKEFDWKVIVSDLVR